MKIKAILLDIEGTTTPIDFVHKTLFPYAKEKIGAYVRKNFAQLQTEIAQLKTEYRADFTNQIYGRDFREDAPETIVEYLKFLIDVDRKSTPLKSLQGKIWQSGYEAGELKSVVFPDVPAAFERWKSAGKTIAIYSSGSVLAQKLLFRFTDHGDLTNFISNFFDTAVGHKREAASYEKIAASLSFPPVENLFVSDVAAELDAARHAEFQTVLAVREGNGTVRQPIHHNVVASLKDLEI
jgi:enolase-phosphatase E1